MPSPADAFEEPENFERNFSVRTAIEWTLHALAVLALGFAIWQALHVLRQRSNGHAQGSGVRSALASWSTRETPKRAHVVFDSLPTPDLRDWVAAFPGAGTDMTWEGPALKPSAVAVEPVADPKHLARIWVAAPNGSGVVVRDELGAIDSLNTHSGGAVLTAPHVEGLIGASVGGTLSTTTLHDSLTIKPVLVLGVASWEGKFIMTSLEEYGWKVDARFVVSPFAKGIVTFSSATASAPKAPAPANANGTPAEAPMTTPLPKDPIIDTAHYSVVIALDTSASRFASEINTFVHNGGGFIASGPGAAVHDFASLLPGTVGPQIDEGDFTLDTVKPRTALALTPVGQLKSGAVAVEARAGKTTVAAQRVDQGRVLQVGYQDTWRWRMGGMNDPVPLYRSWWSNMVSSVAYAPRTALPSTAVTDQTPMVTLIGTLGRPTPMVAETASFLNDPRLLTALFTLLMAAFFLEWASRRLRGRP